MYKSRESWRLFNQVRDTESIANRVSIDEFLTEIKLQYVIVWLG